MAAGMNGSLSLMRIFKLYSGGRIYKTIGGFSLKLKYSLFGLVASAGCIILCAILLFWNPYSNTPVSRGTFIIIFTMLIFPAGLGTITSFLKNRILMYIVFIWSLPYGLYLSVASIPSIWNLFSVVLILYLVAATRMSKSYSR